MLYLPTPCSQSWEAMTPAGPGRYCAACQQTVVDFTQQTDAEILAHLARAAGGTCGRFRAGQLGRPLAAPATRPLRWQLWLAGVLVAALAAQGCQSFTGEPQLVAPRHLAPPPPPPVGRAVLVDSVVAEAADSTLVGDVAELVADSALVEPAPPGPGPVLHKNALGESSVR